MSQKCLFFTCSEIDEFGKKTFGRYGLFNIIAALRMKAD